MAKKATVPKAVKSNSVTRQEMEIPSDIEINEVELVEFNSTISERTIKAKEITTEGLDLVAKGTGFKSRAEQMMKEEKTAMHKAEELFVVATALAADSKDRSALSNTEIIEVQTLSDEREMMRSKLLDLDRAIKKLKDSSEKNGRKSNALGEDAIDRFETAERLKLEANKLFSEASKYSEEGQAMINEGNESITRAQVLSNSSLDDVISFDESDFTREIKMDLTSETPATEVMGEETVIIVEEDIVLEEVDSKHKKGLFSKK
jgi:hypothetical protein